MNSELKVNSIYQEGSIFYFELFIPFFEGLGDEDEESDEDEGMELRITSHLAEISSPFRKGTDIQDPIQEEEEKGNFKYRS